MNGKRGRGLGGRGFVIFVEGFERVSMSYLASVGRLETVGKNQPRAAAFFVRCRCFLRVCLFHSHHPPRRERERLSGIGIRNHRFNFPLPLPQKIIILIRISSTSISSSSSSIDNTIISKLNLNLNLNMDLGAFLLPLPTLIA